VSKTTSHEAVTEKLGQRKLCARLVPKMLTDDHETKRMGSALKFLTRYTQEGDEFLDSIAKGDETWIFHHTPASSEVQEVMTWFKGQAVDFYDSGIQKLVPRLNKCLNNAGDYIEK
jgi:hypothetical protein